ncbi:transporter substrate-binding domain-containing protein [Roseateles asaccharophilus]|uniref:ABC-type amino acid transport substrate-binding protein n=1 Tax=Roseateles asaccharophilus TaxID=582607 RepID=A0ABU2A3V1_9BURK|nr:transporter substrate-binding domain-containing protein [Roseateles asaccharophilus]MDR7331860.1 ABC-type amino acid transport substrate-binding protein [Roseateles asaccharophilus]
MRRFLLSLAFVCGPATALGLNLVVFPNPGLFEVEADQSIGGRGAVLLHKLADVSGLTLNLQAMPIPRALSTGAATPGSCLVGMTRTPEREAQFQWAGPLASGALVVYARGDDTRLLQTPADLRGHGVVVQRDSAPAAWLRQQGITAQEVSQPVTALRMLQAGRIDFWLANELSAAPAIQAEGGNAIKAHLVVMRIDAYIACHPGTPAELTARLHQALQKMRRQGDLAHFGLK